MINMSMRRLLLSIASLLLITAGCRDGAPPLAPADSAQGTRLLQMASQTDLQFEAIGASVESSGRMGRASFKAGDPAAALLGPSVDKYLVSFWSVNGKDRTIQINYLSNGKSSPYLRFSTKEPAWAPAVGEIAKGDSILITVIVDPTIVGATFLPAGLKFKSPSTLQIWYGGVGGDLNGDGLVNADDATIERKLLGMSYRENIFKPWELIPYKKNTIEKWTWAEIYHFSEYAVSW
jgi:hypothetical protein